MGEGEELNVGGNKWFGFPCNVIDSNGIPLIISVSANPEPLTHSEHEWYNAML